MGVCGEVEGGGDDDTFSEVTAVVMWCVVVGGWCVLLAVATVGKLTSFVFVVVKLVVGCAVVVFVTVSFSAAVMAPAKTQTQ